MWAGSGPEITDRIAARDHIAVMFDNKDCIPQVTQSLHRLNQPTIVPRVQPDRRLVEHIKYPTESRPELTRESNPLRLSSRERIRGATDR
jgi:hypothetical protein